jgi:hypothetical protein
MNALANPPVPGLVSDFPVKPVAAVSDAAIEMLPRSSDWTLERIKDVLMTIYALGLLGFGVLFPFVLVAWKLLFGPMAE